MTCLVALGRLIGRNRQRALVRLGRLVSAASLAAMVACSPGSNLPPLPNSEIGAYQLGPGDQVRIITFGEDQLSGNFRVGDTGFLNVPLLGSVAANGLSTDQLAAEISQQLIQRKLFRDPSVAVEISDYRPVFILGEVSKPGQYSFRPGMTVLSAVALAGGFTYRAVEDRASIVRTEGNHAKEGKVTREAYVQPGDVVTIFERTF